jgi:AcrR family transcriptional regulator
VSQSATSYHHGDLREALLRAAEEILDQEGLPGLTLRACARRAGVSHAAPKHHFPDLADLLAEVAARGFSRLTLALREARAAAGSDPELRFVAVSRTYVQFAQEHPAHFRLMFRSDALNQSNRGLRSAATETFVEMTNSISVQRGAPDVTPDDLLQRIADDALMQDILIGWSHVHGYALLLLEGQLDIFSGSEDRDLFVERTLKSAGGRLSRMLQVGQKS